MRARAVSVTGDTVWYDGVAEVARRLPAGLALFFAGAAKKSGPFRFTMEVNGAIETAHAFPRRHDCSGSLRRPGAFQPERRRFQAIIQVSASAPGSGCLRVPTTIEL